MAEDPTCSLVQQQHKVGKWGVDEYSEMFLWFVRVRDWSDSVPVQTLLPIPAAFSQGHAQVWGHLLISFSTAPNTRMETIRV